MFQTDPFVRTIHDEGNRQLILSSSAPNQLKEEV
jgi:hypothetical protein